MTAQPIARTPRRTSAATAFVWAWLPRATEPVVAGRLEAVGDVVVFNYGRSYLQRPGAIPLYLPELPLEPGRIRPLPGLQVAGCIKDAGPDAWGQRVILARHAGRLTPDSDTAELGLITYLLESGSDRIGALDFQTSATDYTPRSSSASLEELQSYHLTVQDAADVIEHQVTTITEQWDDAADAAQLTAQERRRLWGRQILNPYVRQED